LLHQITPLLSLDARESSVYPLARELLRSTGFIEDNGCIESRLKTSERTDSRNKLLIPFADDYICAIPDLAVWSHEKNNLPSHLALAGKVELRSKPTTDRSKSWYYQLVGQLVAQGFYHYIKTLPPPTCCSLLSVLLACVCMGGI
jgi:hypothetical protein